jgi:hypothetical protein
MKRLQPLQALTEASWQDVIVALAGDRELVHETPRSTTIVRWPLRARVYRLSDAMSAQVQARGVYLSTNWFRSTRCTSVSDFPMVLSDGRATARRARDSLLSVDHGWANFEIPTVLDHEVVVVT